MSSPSRKPTSALTTASQLPLPPQQNLPTYPRTPFPSNVRAHAHLLSAWISANPFVSSFVEDLNKQVPRETRANTLHNRRNYSYDDLRNHPSNSSKPSATSSSLPSSSASSFSSDSARSLSFAHDVLVYAQDKPSAKPVVERIKPENKKPPLESRHSRGPTRNTVDPFAPTSAAGQWLQRKGSSSDLTASK